MLQLTPAAAAQVLLSAAQTGIEDPNLRLAVARKADGAFDYRMGFDQAQEEDISFNTEGVKILIAPEDAPLLDQALLDFVELDKGDWQFIFLNPLDPSYIPPQPF